MRNTLKVMLGLTLCVGLATFAFAEEKKEKGKEETLKGTIVCTKCELGETPDCGNAIKVKVDGKDVVYYIKDKGKKEKYHGKFCTAPAEGSVTGVVSEKDKKKFITPSKDGVKID